MAQRSRDKEPGRLRRAMEQAQREAAASGREPGRVARAILWPQRKLWMAAGKVPWVRRRRAQKLLDMLERGRTKAGPLTPELRDVRNVIMRMPKNQRLRFLEETLRDPQQAPQNRQARRMMERRMGDGQQVPQNREARRAASRKRSGA
jgi:hypothetical protein